MGWPGVGSGSAIDARVIVVGGGSAGLACAAALHRRGADVTVLERGDGVGTSWRRRHEELRLNTIRWLSGLPGGRIPRSAGRWVRRDDYVAYLEQFASREGLDVRLGVGVTRIDRAADGRWSVDSSEGEHRADHVVVATGHEHSPHVPEWPGSFAGPTLHVSEIRRFADMAGQRVLLVGAGNSGVEVAEHLVNSGVEQLWISVRTPPTIVPPHVAGIPLHPAAVLMQFLPEGARDALVVGLSKLVIGDLTPYGLPRPKQGPYARIRNTGVTAAIDRGFVRHLRARRLQIVPQIEWLDGAEVVLRSGQRLRPDVVLAATGFRTGLESLVGHLGVLTNSGHPLTGTAQPIPNAPGLWFAGYRTAIEGNLRQHPGEARRIARGVASAQETSSRPSSHTG